jgi:hypothetical protein
MPNHAAQRRAGHRMMTRHVTDNSANRGTLDTTVGIGDDGKRAKSNRQ